MSNQELDNRKLNMIKIKTLQIEKSQMIRKDPHDMVIDSLRKYIEKVVDGKC